MIFSVLVSGCSNRFKSTDSPNILNSSLPNLEQSSDDPTPPEPIEESVPNPQVPVTAPVQEVPVVVPNDPVVPPQMPVTPPPVQQPMAPVTCSETVYNVLIFNSSSNYRTYFANSTLNMKLGDVVAYDGNGYTGFFSCVQYPNTSVGTVYLRSITPDYNPNPTSVACQENLYDVMRRAGISTIYPFREHFINSQYKMAEGESAAIQGLDGWVLPLKCKSGSFDIGYVVAP